MERLIAFGQLLTIELAVSFTGGMLLGTAFFWGLWITVSELQVSSRPGMRILGSMLLRFILLAGGLYLAVHDGGWQYLIAAAVGFMLSRFLMLSRIGLHRQAQERNS